MTLSWSWCFPREFRQRLSPFWSSVKKIFRFCTKRQRKIGKLAKLLVHADILWTQQTYRSNNVKRRKNSVHDCKSVISKSWKIWDNVSSITLCHTNCGWLSAVLMGCNQRPVIRNIVAGYHISTISIWESNGVVKSDAEYTLIRSR